MSKSIQILGIAMTVLCLAGGAIAQTGSPLLAPVEERVLHPKVVTLGTARYGLPQSISIVPSALKAKPGLITTLPLRNREFDEGRVMLTVSGRPTFVVQGEIPAYRDLVPGTSGDDVRQLEQALVRLGFDPGPPDGTFDTQTSGAVAKWYAASGWEPFGPTITQLMEIRTLEQNLSTANKTRLAAAGAAKAAAFAVESARATAEHANGAAASDVEARTVELDKAKADLANAALAVEAAHAKADHLRKVANADLSLKLADPNRHMGTKGNGTPMAVEAARTRAEFANQAAKADVAARIADRAIVMMDPRQPRTARASADAQLELARAAAQKIELEGEVAVQTAERDARLVAEQFEVAQAAVKAAQLDGEVTIQAALNAQKAAERQVNVAERQLDLALAAAKVRKLDGEAAVQAAMNALKVADLDLKMSEEQASRLEDDLNLAKSKVGIQVPADEIVFLPALPVRMEQANVLVGDPASGPVMAVTDTELAIDSSVPVDTASLVNPGMEVDIEHLALGIAATGVVQEVADIPGTQGVDTQSIYVKVRVKETPTPLEGLSLRLTIPVKSANGAVTAVPISAITLGADGTTRVQVKNESNGGFEYVEVEPGVSAEGFVEVIPVAGALKPGQLVVVHLPE